MMDIQDIDKIPAGREMDTLVAEHVTGWTRHTFNGQDPNSLWDDEFLFNEMARVGYTHIDQESKYRRVPRYSTNIAAAWEVIDKLDESHAAWFEIRGPRVWLAQCSLPGHGRFSATASSGPLAICRAALKALMMLKEDNNE